MTIGSKEYGSKICHSIMDQFQADNAGQTLQQYMEHKEFSNKIREEAKQYQNKPSSEWPEIKINWDLRKKSQRFSLDGVQKNDFKKSYPEGFSLGYVSLTEFDKTLCNYSRRDSGELWTVGLESKLAYLIVYLSKGHPISPPLVAPNSVLPKETIFQGGHHRYAIAKEIGESTIPIYVAPKNKTFIENILSIKWT